MSDNHKPEAFSALAALFPARNVVVFIRDRELAEIAAVGICLAAGWQAEVAHDLAELASLLRERTPSAVLTVALHPSSGSLDGMRELESLGRTHGTPVIVLTPERSLFEQLRKYDLVPVCDSFDPLLLSALISEALTARSALPAPTPASA